MVERTKKIVIKKLFFFLILILPNVCTLRAGIYGTLTGQVKDKETGEPLPGVNITIEGLPVGAATDEDGCFLITQLPPGLYSVTAQMLGYKKETIRNVSILIDLRTTIYFKLEPTTLESSETIVVTAQRPLLQRDITATTHFITHQELLNLPVRNFKQAIQLQPGVVAGHIRGGRQNEVLYLVDGIPIREAIDAEPGSSLPNSAIIDMTIQTGGFNAEYGQAMSGIINIITREGTDHFFGRTIFNSTLLHSIRRPFPNSPPFDHELELAFGFPLTKNINLFFAGNILHPNYHTLKEELGLKHMSYANSSSLHGNANMKLTFKPLNTLKINTHFLLSFWNWREYEHQWKYNLVGLPPQEKKSYRISSSFHFTLSNHSYLNFYLSQYNVLKSVFGKSSRELKPVIYEKDSFGLPNYAGYVLSGDYPWWMDHQEIHYLFKADYTNQINYHHKIQTGIELTQYDLYKKNVLRKELISYDNKFPRYISYDTEYHYKPYQGAFYLQDRIELDVMVANIGVRYDFFNPRAQRPAIERQIINIDSAWIVHHASSVPARIKFQISPRIGVTFPITKTSDIRFNYGHFFQMPQFEYLYTNTNLNVTYGFAPLGDPDLKPARTIAYEMGYRASFHDTYLLDITLFTKEVNNLVDSNTLLNSNPHQGGIFTYGYTQFVNSANVYINGLEILLKKRFNNFMGGSISYTFMHAKGMSSSAFDQVEWLDTDIKPSLDEHPLSWDQRHTLVIDLNIKFTPTFKGNFLWRWNSPLPYTHYQGPNTYLNNARLTSTYFLDLRVEKTFFIKNNRTQFYGEIYNLFGNEFVLWKDIYNRTGGPLHDISAYDLGRRIQLGIIFHYK